MKFSGLVAVSFIWVMTWFLNHVFFLFTLMMTDYVGYDKLEEILVTLAAFLTSAYFITVPTALIIAWVAYFLKKMEIVQIALVFPLIHIAIYIMSMILVMIWQSILVGRIYG